MIISELRALWDVDVFQGMYNLQFLCDSDYYPVMMNMWRNIQKRINTQMQHPLRTIVRYTTYLISHTIIYFQHFIFS